MEARHRYAATAFRVRSVVDPAAHPHENVRGFTASSFAGAALRARTARAAGWKLLPTTAKIRLVGDSLFCLRGMTHRFRRPFHFMRWLWLATLVVFSTPAL